VLASDLECEPAALHFTQGAHGKPGLSGVQALQFSISHAGGRMLLAVASDAQVGIDLETMRARPRDDLARRMLGPAATAHYDELAPEARNQAFAWAWAEREAYVKALGLGIGDGWQMVNALFARLSLVAAPQPAECRNAGGWVLHYLPGLPGFACVVCSGRRADRIQLFDPEPHTEEVPSASLTTATLS
jgi:phosphopantetheinyl transferase